MMQQLGSLRDIAISLLFNTLKIEQWNGEQTGVVMYDRTNNDIGAYIELYDTLNTLRTRCTLWTMLLTQHSSVLIDVVIYVSKSH